jgi:hypothetical protein
MGFSPRPLKFLAPQKPYGEERTGILTKTERSDGNQASHLPAEFLAGNGRSRGDQAGLNSLFLEGTNTII